MKNILTASIALVLLAGCHHGAYMPDAPAAPPSYPPAVHVAIDPALQQEARAEILNDLHSTDEVIRAHALETIKDLRLTDVDQDVVAALRDRSLLVRKAAAMVAGELQIQSAAPVLPELMQTEGSTDDAVSAEQERMAAIFALHRLGNTKFSHEFEQTAFDARAHIRGETAFILGLLGEKSAVPILRQMLEKDRDPNVKLQAGEALWRLGDERGEDALLAGTVSSYASDQMLAVMALAEPHNTMVLGHVEGVFDSDYVEVRLVAARAAGMLGSDHGYGIALDGAKSTDPRQRALAAMALGDIGRSDAQPVLSKLLKDPSSDVRLAAAGALMAIGEKS